eukprot:2814482-Rhodomonas_salina.2
MEEPHAAPGQVPLKKRHTKSVRASRFPHSFAQAPQHALGKGSSIPSFCSSHTQPLASQTARCKEVLTQQLARREGGEGSEGGGGGGGEGGGSGFGGP